MDMDVVRALQPWSFGGLGQMAMRTPSFRALLSTKTAARADVTAVSVHGTGTPLGDPIEVGALGQGLQASSTVSNNVLMLSNKACFGHTEGAAGLSGEQHRTTCFILQ